MRRLTTAGGMALLAMLIVPTVALAAEPQPSISLIRLGMSLVGLIVAVLLLLEALHVRQVAFGGAIADRMSYVILAILCLAGSALAQWTRNFVPAVSQAQVQMASEALVIAAMALLATYFYSVRTALQAYLKSMMDTSESAEAQPPAEQGEED